MRLLCYVCVCHRVASSPHSPSIRRATAAVVLFWCVYGPAHFVSLPKADRLSTCSSLGLHTPVYPDR